jgi:hypothetical protein
MRLPKTVHRSNDGFQEVKHRGGGGRGGGQGRGVKAGRGPPGRGEGNGRGFQKEKADETMENEGNDENGSGDSNGDEDMDNEEEEDEDEEEEEVDGVEEYEEENEEKTEEPKANKETTKETNGDHGKSKAKKSFYERAVAEDHSDVQEKLRERGEGYAETVNRYSTQIKIEFNVKAGTTFDVRSSLIKTLEVMKKVDTNMAIVSRKMLIYEKYTELPTGEKFTDEITVKEYHPPRASSKITCYVTLQSKVKFNEIKYATSVMEFLKKNQVYLRVDKYNNSPVSIPGFLIELHPSLIRIDNLTEELTDLIKDLPINNNSEDYQEWLAANKHYDPEDNAEGIHPVPYFRLTSGKRNFGGVSTNVLLVECAKQDARFVKYVLTQIYENPKFDTRGFFVPSGIHLIGGPKLYTALLKKQNQYLNNLAVVTVYGIPIDTLESPIKVEGFEGSLGDYMNHAAEEIIESMEITGQTAETGKWFILCTKTSLPAVQEFFDVNIKEIFINQIPQTEKLEEYPHPTRFLGSTRGKATSRTVDTVGKAYAAVLQGIVSNPQEEAEDTNDPNNKAPPLRPNKRQHTTLSYEDTESFPPLPAKRAQADKSNDHGKKNNNTAEQAKQNNTQEQAAKQTTDLSEFSKKLAAMNTRLQGQMDTMKTDHAGQMDEMLTSFESRFNDMQERMENSHNDLRDLILTIQKTMHTMMDNTTGTTRGTSATSENISTISGGSKRDDKVSTLHAPAIN